MDSQPHAICDLISAPDPGLTPSQDPHRTLTCTGAPGSDLVIPDLPLLAAHPDMCALPPHPHCPGPLLEYATPPDREQDLHFPQPSPRPTHVWHSSTTQFTRQDSPTTEEHARQYHTTSTSRRGDGGATSSATPHSSRCWNSASPTVTPLHTLRPHTQATTHPPRSTLQMSQPTSPRNCSTQPS